MKKMRGLLALCLAVCLLGGIAASIAEAAGSGAEGEPLTVDLDLSKLSGTVVYSQIYNMMYEPEPFIGKVIRMAGYYSAYEDLERNVVYHACVIPDATACCAQGIEFIWAGEHAWPEEYPMEGTDIIVTGRMETYEEDGYMYLHLVDSEVLWEKESED